MEEKDKEYESQSENLQSADEEVSADTNNGKNNSAEYETNDNWKFDAEAPTLSDDIFADKGYEVDPDSLNIQVPKAPQQAANSNDIVINRDKAGFAFLAILVACIIALLVFLGVRYYTVPNGKEGDLMNPASVVAEVDGTKISIGMFNYYYANIVSYYESYASSFGLDTSADYDTQYTTDEDGNQISWADFFQDTTLEEIKTTVAYYNKGVELGLTLNSMQQDTIDEYIESAKTSASDEGVSLDEYLISIYGDYCTEETLLLFYDQYFISANYQGYYKAQQTTTDEEIEEYFNENKDDFYEINFSYIAVAYDSTDAQSIADSQALIDEYLEQITDRDSILELVPTVYSEYIEQDIESAMSSDETLTEEEAREQAIETYESSIDGTISGSAPFGDDINEWFLSDDTPIGSKTYYIDESIGYAYLLLKTEEPTLIDDATYAVRHILIQPESEEDTEEDADTEDTATEDTTTDDTTTDSDTEEEEEYTEEEWAAAEAEAERILELYNNGDQSELSFALLAEQYSQDTGLTSYYGGLYEGVTEGYMVTEFEDWSMDESREYGDTGIIQTDYGYHVMYFVYQEPSYKAEIIYLLNSQKTAKTIEDSEINIHTSVLEQAIEDFYAARETTE